MQCTPRYISFGEYTNEKQKSCGKHFVKTYSTEAGTYTVTVCTLRYVYIVTVDIIIITLFEQKKTIIIICFYRQNIHFKYLNTAQSRCIRRASTEISGHLSDVHSRYIFYYVNSSHPLSNILYDEWYFIIRTPCTIFFTELK